MAESLAGKVAVVTGASGVVGSGIIYSLLSRGATVIAPLRSPGAKDKLLADLEGVPVDKLETPTADVGVPDSASALATQVKSKWGAIDYAVSSLGGWWQKGPLTEQTLEEYNTVIHNNAGSHFVFAKYFAPLLRDSPESGYLFITGGAGERSWMADTSLVHCGVAAVFGISIALRMEYADKAPRVNEFRIFLPIERHADALAGRSAIPGMTPTSHRVCGKVAVDILTSEKKGEIVKATSLEDFKE